jgi:hypothetical protein
MMQDTHLTQLGVSADCEATRCTTRNANPPCQRSTARKGRVVTSDESLRIAPPPVNRPLREPCGKRCATCGAMRCGKPKRR